MSDIGDKKFLLLWLVGVVLSEVVGCSNIYKANRYEGFIFFSISAVAGLVYFSIELDRANNFLDTLSPIFQIA